MEQSTLEKTHIVDFTDTKVAFAAKSDEELKQTAWLFGLMNKGWLVSIGSKLGLLAFKLKLPFVERIVRNTIFDIFCGGTTLLDSLDRIEKLHSQNVYTILDYGAEGKEDELEFNRTMNETIRSLEFASQNESVMSVSTKLTGMVRNELLENIQKNDSLSRTEIREYRNFLKRLDAICFTAHKNGVCVYIDAEESWLQDTIDHVVNLMMKRYNREKVIVFNTFQLYRTDRLQYLIDSFNDAQDAGYKLGAKLVRGAYMDKERDRAKEYDYEDPIYPSKEATDDAYNAAVKFCIENYEEMAFVNATHNAESCMLHAEMIQKKDIPKDHPHLHFSQLLGMSDNITFNLAQEGYHVSKYVPYGAVSDVIPYLIRRTQENAAVTGDMSRELKMIVKELRRRGLRS